MKLTNPISEYLRHRRQKEILKQLAVIKVYEAIGPSMMLITKELVELTKDKV